MKALLLALIVSGSAYADFVFMKEGPEGKSIQLSTLDRILRVNDVENKLWALYPDITPDGNQIVYSEGPGQSDLSLTLQNKLKNTTVRLHHPIKGLVLHPKFSKNGKLLFYSAPQENGKNSLFVVKPAADSDPVAIVPDEEAYFPRPSSDGGFVVYQRNVPGKKEIVLFDRVENKKTVLAEGMSPSLSFDERLIAFTSKEEGHWNIFVIDRFTGERKRVTSHPADELAPTFRTDNTLVFASNKDGQFRLYDEKGNVLVKELDEKISHYSPQFTGETAYQQSELPPYLGAERSSFGTIVHEGKLYMSGGHQGKEHTYPPESFSDQFLVYDLTSKEWRELAPRPHKAHGYQLAAFGPYVYAFGGFAYSPDHKPRWKSLAAIDRYDIRTNTWKTIGALNSPRSSNVASTIGDKVYLLAGWDSTPKKENDPEGRFHDTIEIFDLRTEKVSVAPFGMPLPLRRALSGIEHNGKIILIGGLGEGASHFELINLVTEIDPETGATRELAPLPFATFAPAAGIIDDELFVFGGMFKTGPMNFEYVAHVYGMSLSENQWRHTGRYVRETKGFSQVFNLNEKTLGVLGGHHYFEGYDLPVKTFETFKK